MAAVGGLGVLEVREHPVVLGQMGFTNRWTHREFCTGTGRGTGESGNHQPAHEDRPPLRPAPHINPFTVDDLNREPPRVLTPKTEVPRD